MMDIYVVREKIVDDPLIQYNYILRLSEWLIWKVRYTELCTRSVWWHVIPEIQDPEEGGVDTITVTPRMRVCY